MSSRAVDVVRAITRLNIGGPARHALLLTRELASEFPTLLTAGRAPSVEGELTDPAVDVVRAPLVRPVRPIVDARAVMFVRRLLTDTRPRLLHTHMAKAGAVGRIAAARVDPRPVLVHTFHGHVLNSYFARPIEDAFIRVERKLARACAALIAVSDEIRDELLALGIGRPEQYRVVPVGLDLTPFLDAAPSGELRRRLAIPPGSPVIGAVGRLVPVKNLGMLIDATRALPGAHLVLAGDGEARPGLEAHARRAGVQDRVHFLGWVRDPPRVLADVDVVALTSDNEGTPLAVIEALAAGRPVVAADVGGVRSIVDHGRTGLLFSRRDLDGLVAALGAVVDSPRLRLALGEEGRADVSARFGSNRLVADVASLYRELLGKT